MKGFSIRYRNPGHWDIIGPDERAFRIRGIPGDVVVHDERREGLPFPRKYHQFRSVQVAMAWCCDQLMHEGEWDATV